MQNYFLNGAHVKLKSYYILVIMYTNGHNDIVIIVITRIENVLSRYINLPDQERDNAVSFPEPPYRRGIQNKEYFLRILQQLRSENDVSLHMSNPGDINSEIEELQQEVCRLQQQLQMAEEQIRVYEPDPLKMTSIAELETSEKNVVETLSRVMQRKEVLLNNQLSSYDPSSIQVIK